MKLIVRFADNPVGFVETVLKHEPDEIQKRYLERVATEPWVEEFPEDANMKAWTALWFFMTRWNAKILLVSPHALYLRDVLWPAVIGSISRSWMQDNGLCVAGQRIAPNGCDHEWYIRPLYTPSPEPLRGFAGDHLLFLVSQTPLMRPDVLEVLSAYRGLGSDCKVVLG